MNTHSVTIVPPTREGGVTPAQGTQVLNADGELIPCVTRVELDAKVGDVWRARIHVAASVPTIEGVEAEIVEDVPAADVLAEVRAMRAELQANTAATTRLAEAIEGMAVILSSDAGDDPDAAADGGQPAPVARYTDGSPIG